MVEKRFIFCPKSHSDGVLENSFKDEYLEPNKIKYEELLIMSI